MKEYLAKKPVIHYSLTSYVPRKVHKSFPVYLVLHYCNSRIFIILYFVRSFNFYSLQSHFNRKNLMSAKNKYRDVARYENTTLCLHQLFIIYVPREPTKCIQITKFSFSSIS